jgi:enoyl-CoA hydratase
MNAVASVPPVGLPADALAIIGRAFRHSTVEAILAALGAEDNEFARATHALLLSKSPTSLRVTLALLRAGRESPNLQACLAREFAATPAVLASHDFYEGVRAAVIDKDRNPRWSPATLDAVEESAVAGFFAPHPHPLY